MGLYFPVGEMTMTPSHPPSFQEPWALIEAVMLVSPRMERIFKRQLDRQWRQIAQELVNETDSEKFLELSEELLKALDERVKFDA